MIEYKAGPLTFGDRGFDVSILADMLHERDEQFFVPDIVRSAWTDITSPRTGSAFTRHGLVPVAEQTSIDLYPPAFNMVIGRKLQDLRATHSASS